MVRGLAGVGDQSWDNAKGTGAFGGLAGGDVGINWQTGSFVYGLEGDFAGVFGGESSYIEKSGGGDQTAGRRKPKRSERSGAARVSLLTVRSCT